MMATVPHVTSGLGLRKFQADGFLLTRVYNVEYCYELRVVGHLSAEENMLCQTEVGENYVIKTFMICTPYQIVLG